MNVGFAGLGSMGFPMARNILKAGHSLTVYNRTKSKGDELLNEGGVVANTPIELASGKDVVFTMLANDEAVQAIVWGDSSTEGLLQGLPQGSVHVSMSTISVALARRLAEAHRSKGHSFVSAPVFGRPEAAAGAKLWIVAAGDEQQISRIKPLLEAMGQGVFVIGAEPSRANVIKICGNFMIAAMLEAMGESFAMVRKAGIDVNQFLEILNSLFRSPVYQNYGGIIAAERYEPAGFKLTLGLKDVKLALEAAEGTSTPLPLASLIHDHLVTGIARGYGDLDWSGLARVIADDAGIATKGSAGR